MFCRNCGKEVKDEWNICPYCNTKITKKAGGMATETYESPIIEEQKEDHDDVIFIAVEKKLENFNYVRFLLLSLVTCGIYGIYKLYKFVETVNELCEGDDKKSPNYIVVILLGSITCGVYTFYWIYKQAQRLNEIAPKYNCQVKETGNSILLWSTFGTFILVGPLIAWYHMFRNTNLLIDQYNEKNINKNFTFVNIVPQSKAKTICIIVAFYVVIFFIEIFRLPVLDEEPSTTDAEDVSDSIEEVAGSFQVDTLYGEYVEEGGDLFGIYEYDGYTSKGERCVAQIADTNGWTGYITDKASTPIQVVTLEDEVIALLEPGQEGITANWGNGDGTKWYSKISEDAQDVWGLTYDFDEDVENGLLYCNTQGQITDPAGNVIETYSYISALENGRLYDGQAILESYAVGNDGKIVQEERSAEAQNVTSEEEQDEKMEENSYAQGIPENPNKPGDGDEYITEKIDEKLNDGADSFMNKLLGVFIDMGDDGVDKRNIGMYYGTWYDESTGLSIYISEGKNGNDYSVDLSSVGYGKDMAGTFTSSQTIYMGDIGMGIIMNDDGSIYLDNISITGKEDLGGHYVRQ